MTATRERSALDSMRKIAEAVGLAVSWANPDRKGNARGILVESAA